MEGKSDRIEVFSIPGERCLAGHDDRSFDAGNRVLHPPSMSMSIIAQELDERLRSFESRFRLVVSYDERTERSA